MIDFDMLLAMSDEEKLDHLEGHVAGMLSGASPNQKLPLQALQARIKGLRTKYRTPAVAILMVLDCVDDFCRRTPE